MSDKAKDLAKQISELITEFESCSPDLSGYLEIINSHGDNDEVDWNLHLDDEEVKIVIETGASAVYIDHESMVAMLAATDFFSSLGGPERKLLMSILERDEDGE